MTLLKENIIDAFDSAMKSFIESDEYKQENWEITKMINDLRNEFSEAQVKKINRLINAMEETNARLSEEAFYKGVVYGVELHVDATR